MPHAKANGLHIEYETFGEPNSPAIVLIEGLGSQMIYWPEDFCHQLAASDRYVVRFDNRDVGLSSKIDEGGLPDIGVVRSLIQSGLSAEIPYRLEDMAADTVGLMDALEIEKAHICGISMGGMIAQTMAIEYPRRMLSLISLASSTGSPKLPPPRPGVGEALLEPAPAERDGYIAYMVKLNRLFAGDSHCYDPKIQEAMAAVAFDRCYYPEGLVRQYAAIMVSGNRRAALTKICVPTLVIHGEADTLLSIEHGLDTVAAIPNAQLSIIAGLGHGTAYPDLWGQMVAEMAEFMAHVESKN
jgi:pimeloyl-ACP methyl ester carboxylesterase